MQQSDSLADGAGEISALIHFGMATFFHDGDPGCTPQNWNACDPKGSRRRDCHFTDIPSPSILKHLLEGEGGSAE